MLGKPLRRFICGESHIVAFKHFELHHRNGSCTMNIALVLHIMCEKHSLSFFKFRVTVKCPNFATFGLFATTVH